MDKIELKIIGLSYSQTQSGAYALVLSEKDGNRRLPIIIGGFEAQSIAIELEKMKPSRPLTHDLFKTFSDVFKVKIKEIIIYNLVEGVFFSKIICEKDNKTYEIDARTSDAISIGLRSNSPVYTFENILSSAGIQLENEEYSDDQIVQESESKTVSGPKSESSQTPISELEKQLQEAIQNEDYEAASKIRDEINKRKGLEE